MHLEKFEVQDFKKESSLRRWFWGGRVAGVRWAFWLRESVLWLVALLLVAVFAATERTSCFGFLLAFWHLMHCWKSIIETCRHCSFDIALYAIESSQVLEKFFWKAHEIELSKISMMLQFLPRYCILSWSGFWAHLGSCGRFSNKWVLYSFYLELYQKVHAYLERPVPFPPSSTFELLLLFWSCSQNGHLKWTSWVSCRLSCVLALEYSIWGLLLPSLPSSASPGFWKMSNWKWAGYLRFLGCSVLKDGHVGRRSVQARSFSPPFLRKGRSPFWTLNLLSFVWPSWTILNFHIFNGPK